jgi:hypothetical protein
MDKMIIPSIGLAASGNGELLQAFTAVNPEVHQ